MNNDLIGLDELIIAVTKSGGRVDADILNRLKTALTAIRDATIEEAEKAISVHKPGEGQWCDTGEDMDWACRSDCVRIALKALRETLN